MRWFAIAVATTLALSVLPLDSFLVLITTTTIGMVTYWKEIESLTTY